MAKKPGDWIEPPPETRAGLGCFGKGVIALILLAFLAVIGAYFLISHGLVASQPAQVPVAELPPQALADVQQRIAQFENTPPTVATPAPTPVQSDVPTPTPSTSPTPAATPRRELLLSSSEINGLIAANRRSRGHAFVSISGNTASVQVSIPSKKVPGLADGYLNGTFQITTDGPTPISSLQVSKIRANGIPVPSSILGMNYRGQSLLSYALGAAAPYNVSSAEVRDGNVILH
jgi:hypothetical protein